MSRCWKEDENKTLRAKVAGNQAYGLTLRQFPKIYLFIPLHEVQLLISFLKIKNDYNYDCINFLQTL